MAYLAFGLIDTYINSTSLGVVITTVHNDGGGHRCGQSTHILDVLKDAFHTVSGCLLFDV